MFAFNLLILGCCCKISYAAFLDSLPAFTASADLGLPPNPALTAIPTIQSGTITAPSKFDAKADAEEIYYSGDSFEKLLDILTHRIAVQRSQIYVEYETLYKTGLRFSTVRPRWGVFRQAGSRFEDAAYTMMLGDPDKAFVAFLEGAFWTSFNSRHQMVLQILVTAEQYRPALQQAYNDGRFFSLETYVNYAESGDFRNFIKELLHRTRAPDGPVDPTLVQADVDALIKEIAEDLKNSRKVLDTILMERPRSHIRELVNQYPQLESDIISSLEGDDLLVNGYVSLLAVALDHNGYVARRIHDNLKEADVYGTMTAFIVGYCETCLPHVKVRFQEQYNISMKEYILNQGPNDTEEYAETKQFLAAIVGD